nr:hypothetical protein [Paenibacillus sp. Marseille-Q4541]
MSKLYDKKNNGTYVEFIFLKCIPGKFEGCQLNFKYYREHNKIYELNFGWTNVTIKNYIEVTTKFPLEMLNNFILNRTYSSFEKHLYQLEWKKLREDKTYHLRFFGSQQDFSIIVVDDAVRQFGRDLETEWKEGIRLAQ